MEEYLKKIFINEAGIPMRIQNLLPMKVGNPTIEKIYLLGQTKDFLPKNLLPFAIDEGSNFFCIDESGKIYFYAIDALDEDLNNEENKKAATKYIATSLNDFLENLKSKIIKQ